MRSRLYLLGLAAVALCVLTLPFGCQQSGDPSAPKATPPTNLQADSATGAKPAKAGVPDMEDYPAPPNVKTGIEGGRK
jgi:hypothetical protein